MSKLHIYTISIITSIDKEELISRLATLPHAEEMTISATTALDGTVLLNNISLAQGLSINMLDINIGILTIKDSLKSSSLYQKQVLEVLGDATVVQVSFKHRAAEVSLVKDLLLSELSLIANGGNFVPMKLYTPLEFLKKVSDFKMP